LDLLNIYLLGVAASLTLSWYSWDEIKKEDINNEVGTGHIIVLSLLSWINIVIVLLDFTFDLIKGENDNTGA